MSTRQLRISDPQQIRARMNGLLGKRVQIVFTDSTTLAGELTTADAQKFTLENMRQQRISYPINTIAEIYFDTLS